MAILDLPKKIIIFDSEFTTWEGSLERNWSGPNEHREIVQLAAALVDTETFKEISVFESFSKPTVNPILSDCFVNLTHITQKEVNEKGVAFPEMLLKFSEWSNTYDLYSFSKVDRPTIFDLDALKDNCRILGIDLPFEDGRFKNINKIFHDHGYLVKQSGSTPESFGIEIPARPHNAMNDVRGLIIGLKALNEKLGAS